MLVENAAFCRALLRMIQRCFGTYSGMQDGLQQEALVHVLSVEAEQPDQKWREGRAAESRDWSPQPVGAMNTERNQ